MIYLLRGLLYIVMGAFLFLNGNPAFPLDDIIRYVALFLAADAGILLFIRRKVHVFEAVYDLLVVICLFYGLIDTVGLLIRVFGAWYVVTGIGHLAEPKRPGVAAFLVLGVGVVMLLFGIILFFREGIGMAGFMGMSGMFLLLPGIIMILGGLIGGDKDKDKDKDKERMT